MKKCSTCHVHMTLLRYEVENEGKPNERTLKVYQCQNSECENYSKIEKVPA